ncbi:hypothetical protein NKR23_g5509 [Pleurostoma richardsiae]|uniref:Uncharacterized protein n=1 Tax=Pleurostoma richardsiae TaxID=41990 RepID=A0AA38VEU7_9PEZI|nr:hypothetical protein NKR23_g5509 [Pleurostoma richardsiae]
MADPQSDDSNAPTRKRIAVAVSSLEAPIRESGDYAYNIEAARPFAHRGSVGQLGSSSISQYGQDLGSGEMLASYRAGQAYAYNGKQYYSGMASWNGSYGDDGGCGSGGGVDYSLNYSSYPVLNHDPGHMVPYHHHWPAGSRSKSASSSVYVDPDAGYPYGAGNASLVHRPAAVPSGGDARNFSLSSVAASLPSSSADRLLPTPTASRAAPSSLSTAGSAYRTDGLPPYAPPAKPAGPQISPTSPASDVATAYAGSFEGQPLASYAGAGATVSGQTGRASHGSSSSASTFSVDTGGDAIFGEQERSVGSQGSAVDLTGYTYGMETASSLRRISSGSCAVASRTAPGELPSENSPPYGPADGQYHRQHHRQHHRQYPLSAVPSSGTSSGYATELAAPPGTVPSTGGGSVNGSGLAADNRASANIRR